MSAPIPTPPLRYSSHRRLSSPLAPTPGDAQRHPAGTNDDADSDHVPADLTQLGAAARIRYAQALGSSGEEPSRPSAEEEAAHDEGKEAPAESQRHASAALRSYAGHHLFSSSPPPPLGPPPMKSFADVGGAGPHTVGDSKASSSVFDVPAAPSNGAPPSVEDWQFTLHALQHENRILRQRIEVLTSSDVVDDDLEKEGSERAPQALEVPRELLLKRIARLEAALQLEALERDVVEQRLLAQERVLRAVCTPVPLPAPAANS
ncbi:hypothetical protein ABL78_3366 [Leptomonas seymouri]|uniref:Uncharacterized protein n=1 Tax=Leptomonas seymouri TaxID=5684 RepID=A0A0N0P6F8_LEPSE|nr:hypothetical protein ABL78_3366 [Leptomonas seymouri]|eukprot:KPI87569.1 hypothetical protein ABL78_3366 [Leptomonas seymouri]